MSKRHQASRRRTYGRRQHELAERRERAWQPLETYSDGGEDALVTSENPTTEYRTLPYGATWIGLE